MSENKNVNNKIIFGIFYMLAASAFIGGTAVVAKILGKDYFGEPLSPFQISQSRFLYGFVFVLIFTFFNKRCSRGLTTFLELNFLLTVKK